jgi:sugar-specific transcriptional regulator TrmB
VKKIIPTTSRPVPKKISKEPEDLSKKEMELETATPPEFSKEKPKRIVPVSKASKPKVPVSKSLISKDGDSSIKPVLLKESGSEKPVEPGNGPVPKHIDVSKLKSAKRTEKDDQEFVKNRLKHIKETYLKNPKDIESIIDERLDSFKGTLDTLKSESQEPSIIWSFDAGDVQEALKDTIDKAQTKILMMYPWIRNVDVSILKKFMDTESRMIIQEASLNDDTSVELIKLLLENNVKIRTMPHIHTVAVVSDNTNGLIISTDPIYESFEVGVMYKDQKSIEEIERLFEDAWGFSKDLDMELTQ